MNIIGYDIEVFRNTFTITAIDVNDLSKVEVYVIHHDMIGDDHRNDLLPIMQFINRKQILLGYNSLAYDDILLKYILVKFNTFTTTKDITNKLYKFNKMVIAHQSNDNFDKYVYQISKHHSAFKSIDYKTLMHLKFKRLKQVLINLKWHNILDYEMPDICDKDRHLYNDVHDIQLQSIQVWHRYVLSEYLDELLVYNENDVLGLIHAFHNDIEEVMSRFDISIEYGIDCLSDSRSRVASRVMAHLYSKLTGMHFNDFRKWKTFSKGIVVKDIINPIVQFGTKEMNDALDYFKSKVVNENNSKLIYKFIFDGVQYNMGSGGLHSQDRPQLFKTDGSKFMYIDADVTSYYPYLMINNEAYPKHLGYRFLSLFEGIVTKRIRAKKNKDKKLANILKIVINAIYGKLNDMFDFFYDKSSMLKTTINGQFDLLMLIEALYHIDIHTISANTDGIVCIVPNDRYDDYIATCNAWQKYTSLELEYNKYLIYARRDVNNYITLTDTGEVKRKGDLDYTRPWKDVTKGFDKPIIAYAVEQYFIHDKPIEETINNHTDIYNFMASQKMDYKYTAELHGVVNGKATIIKVPPNFRYIVSRKGKTLIKRSELNKGGNNSLSNLIKGQTVTITNKITEGYKMSDYDVKYEYYIAQATKLRDIIIYSMNTKKRKNKTYTNYVTGGLFEGMI